MLYFQTWQKIAIIAICLLGFLFALPNFWYQRADTAARARTAIEAGRYGGENQPDLATLESQAALWPSWLPGGVVNLGLDLRGGVHLLVDVQLQEVFAEHLQSLRRSAFDALREAGIDRKIRVDGDQVIVEITDPADMTRAGDVLRGLARPVGMGLGGVGGSDTDVAQMPGGYALTLSPAGMTELSDRAMTQSLEIMRRRIDETGTREPIVQRQGDRRILIQVPGLSSSQELLDIIGKTAKLSFHSVLAVGAEARTPGPNEMLLQDEEGQRYLLDRTSVLTGENLADAQLGFAQDTGLPVVNFRLDSSGARIFADYTAANVGRRFAAVLDDLVITAPTIRGMIPGGSGYIEGNFTVESATQLAILLRAGALPASIKVLEQRTVGPDLGADSIEAGIWASIVAAIAVLAYMALSYRVFGLFANVALIINMILLFALLSAIGATLTLPGIAGIVLTMGMAVDANVLIYERIREELRRARSIAQAVETGFREAMSAIIDSNITTLIAGAILFFVGSGPVRGFAVTLTLGLLTSVFTAVVVTRLMASEWMQRVRPKTLRVERIKYLPDETNFRIMRWRKPFLIGSVVAVLGAAALVPTVGLNYGIDFQGGTLVEIRTPGEADLALIRETANGLGFGDVSVQTFGTSNDVLLRVPVPENATGDEQNAAAQAVGQALQQAIPETEIRRIEVVGPSVSAELLQAGVIAVLLSFVGILVYVWLRFEWQFGVAAIAGLVHDVAVTMGIIALLGIEFNLQIIAALLTIVGYSLNDSVVVFDRMRENLRKFKQMDLKDLIDLSINQTLARTLMTGVTTLLALVSLFILGPEVLAGFTFAMIWGVLIGTYSTIFIASPLMLYMGVKRDWSAPTEGKAGVKFGGAQV
jgi:preprotein translocase subunit SecD